MDKNKLAERRQYLRKLREGVPDSEILGSYCKKRLENCACVYWSDPDDKEFVTLEAIKVYLLDQKVPKENVDIKGAILTAKLKNVKILVKKLYMYDTCSLEFVEPCPFKMELSYKFSPSKAAEFIVAIDGMMPQILNDYNEIVSGIEKSGDKNLEEIRKDGLKAAKLQKVSKTAVETYVKNYLSIYGSVKYVHYKNFSRVYLTVSETLQLEFVLDYSGMTERFKTLHKEIEQLLSLIDKEQIIVRGQKVKKFW